MTDWGKRVCIICKKEFEPRYPAHIACSPECAKERKRALKKASNIRYRAKTREMLAECIAGRETIARLEKEIFTLRQELDLLKLARDENIKLANHILTLEAENGRLARLVKEQQTSSGEKIKSSEVEDFLKTHKLQECKRLRLKALKLPCGQKAQCWNDTPCKNTKGMKRPENLYNLKNHSAYSSKEINDEL